MGDQLSCYRCGHSLELLPLPLGRRDECPGCTADLHVCRMCRMYDRREPTGCTEEDALEVTEKERANFCDYFKPSADAFSPELIRAHDKAQSEAAALFGGAPPSDAGGARTEPGGESEPAEKDDALTRAEDLFKS